MVANQFSIKMSQSDKDFYAQLRQTMKNQNMLSEASKIMRGQMASLRNPKN